MNSRVAVRPSGVLVLCEEHDASALWAAEGLRQRTMGPVDVVTGSMLAGALSWEHRIRGDVAEVEITLTDGRRISSGRPRPVLNRLSFVPTDRLEAAGDDDRHYASQELHALFLSWLWAHPGRMLNRPSPPFLAGHWRHPAAWAVLAARAGLPTVRYQQTSDDPPGQAAFPAAYGRPATDHRPSETVFVVAGRVVPAPGVPGPALDACRWLAELAGDELLGIEIAATGGGRWEFVTATPLPDLRLGGPPLLNALASALGGLT